MGNIKRKITIEIQASDMQISSAYMLLARTIMQLKLSGQIYDGDCRIE